jgi:hypothetical protein
MKSLHGPYISLEEASSKLAEMGMHGQTTRVLRTAISNRLLAGVKDGRRWRTTERAIDEYLARIWNARGRVQAPTDPLYLLRDMKPKEPKPRKRPYLPHSKRPKPEPAPRPVEKVLTREEREIRRQWMQDYLNGRRATWREELPESDGKERGSRKRR